MNKTLLKFTLASILWASASVVLACEYKAGETKYLDYANCRYGEDSILAIQLGKDSSWNTCVYYLEAFRPEKLLAVTKEQDGKEVTSINDRSKIGNPCYLTKQSCDAALKKYNEGL